MQTLWTGTFRFDNFDFPVKLVPATHGNKIKFHSIHKKCSKRLYNDKRCPMHGPVKLIEEAKGYEIAPNKYVVFERKDLKRIAPAFKKLLIISHFTEKEDIDPIFFKKTYLVKTEPDHDRKYAAFAQALGGKNLFGIGKLFTDRKEYLVAIWIKQGTIMCSVLRYAHELNPIENMNTMAASEKNPLVAKMEKSIEDNQKKIDLSRVEDQFLERITRVLAEKIIKQESNNVFEFCTAPILQYSYQRKKTLKSIT